MFPIGFQDIDGISEVVEASASSSGEGTKGVHARKDTSNGASGSGLFGLRFPGFSASFLTRTRSATSAVVEQSRSRSQQS
jgi:hypothetical protein